MKKKSPDVWRQPSSGSDISSLTLDEQVYVPLVAQVPGVYGGVILDVGRLQGDLAPGVRPAQNRVEGVALLEGVVREVGLVQLKIRKKTRKLLL